MAYLVDPSAVYGPITKSDTVPVGGTGATRGIYVGGTGDLVVKVDANAAAVTFTAVPAGTVLPVRANFVMAATTATAIVGLW